MSKEELRENISLQLAEVEMLWSMYPNDEFQVVNSTAVSEYQDFLQQKCSAVSSWLDFLFALQLPEGQVDVDIHLPHGYPNNAPLEISARSARLTREARSILNKDLLQFVSEQPSGCLCVSSAVEWIIEHFAKYCVQAESTSPPVVEEPRTFSRLWIVSHHIYNKTKRRTILECSTGDLISGFCMPGKPGIICFEGPTENCAEVWGRIKSLTWQRIGLKHREDYTLECNENMDTLRKFDGFREVAFHTKQNPTRDHHMDMGMFLKFMQEHSCQPIFQILFGIEGKVTCS
uniref:RWD domain-containing protein n=1 Tax=Ornithodoros turicata TaxID=34597 RepID=A0A2R5LK82_9ACAR